MFDLMTAARVAIFRALKANVTDDLKGIVYDDVPQNTKPPFIKVGQIDSENISDKGDQLEALTVEVIVIYQGSVRSDLLALMHSARDAIDQRQINADGAAFQLPRFAKGTASDASQGDGVTFAGILTFEVWAEPA